MGQLLPTILGVTTFLSLGTATLTVAETTTEIQIAQKLNCTNPQTQSELNGCAGLSYQQADQKLNQIYRQLLPKLPSARKQKLITAQQIWIKFRDSNCDFEKSEVEGGTMAPLIYSSCLADLTKQRTEQLAEYLKDIK